MNPEFVKTKADQRRVRKEYINNLRLMTSNEQKNYNANLIMKETGQVPMEPLDARSLTEKKADIERLKIELRMRLIESTLMDGSNSSQGVQELIKKPDMLVFAINNFDLIYGYLKPRYSLGVPYLIYLDTIEKLMEEKVNDAFRQFGFFENTTDGGNGGDDDGDDDDSGDQKDKDDKSDSGQPFPPRNFGGKDDTDTDSDTDKCTPCAIQTQIAIQIRARRVALDISQTPLKLLSVQSVQRI